MEVASSTFNKRQATLSPSALSASNMSFLFMPRSFPPAFHQMSFLYLCFPFFLCILSSVLGTSALPSYSPVLGHSCLPCILPISSLLVLCFYNMLNVSLVCCVLLNRNDHEHLGISIKHPR